MCNELGGKRVRLWKKKILDVVGHNNAKLLTELIPELERVIGVQLQMNDNKMATTTLSSVTEETKIRFNHAFQQFAGLFCRFVVVVCLDFIKQWGN